jgi:hypothetical protein
LALDDYDQSPLTVAMRSRHDDVSLLLIEHMRLSVYEFALHLPALPYMLPENT